MSEVVWSGSLYWLPIQDVLTRGRYCVMQKTRFLYSWTFCIRLIYVQKWMFTVESKETGFTALSTTTAWKQQFLNKNDFRKIEVIWSLSALIFSIICFLIMLFYFSFKLGIVTDRWLIIMLSQPLKKKHWKHEKHLTFSKWQIKLSTKYNKMEIWKEMCDSKAS